MCRVSNHFLVLNYVFLNIEANGSYPLPPAYSNPPAISNPPNILLNSSRGSIPMPDMSIFYPSPPELLIRNTKVPLLPGIPPVFIP